MRAIPLVFLFLACGPRYDLNQPIALSVDSPEIPAVAARAAFAQALTQLGGRVGVGQVVHIRWDTACSCASCDPHTAAHTERYSDTIELCPWYLMEPADGLTDNIFHELGHVFGFPDHLPCSTGAMMTPTYNCRMDHAHYQAADVRAICGAGHLTGGVCAGP